MLKNFYTIILSLFIVFNSTINIYCYEPIEDFDYFDYFQITDEFLGKDYKYYTAIGDNISVGYGLDTSYNTEANKKYKVDSFVNLLGKRLKSKDVANLSTSNIDIENLLLSLRQINKHEYIIDAFEEYIEQARVITITLGEDIILEPISNLSNTMTTQDTFSILKDEMKKNELIDEIDARVKKFTGSKEKNYEDGQFMQIIKLLRDMNDYGYIIVQTVYNPYEFSELDKFVNDINSMIEQNQSNQTYKIVDTYSIFENTKEEVILENYPYPNQLGHELIYKEHLKVLNLN